MIRYIITRIGAFEELYKEAYEGLAQPNKHRLPQRFDDEFAKAYELETTA